MRLFIRQQPSLPNTIRTTECALMKLRLPELLGTRLAESIKGSCADQQLEILRRRSYATIEIQHRLKRSLLKFVQGSVYRFSAQPFDVGNRHADLFVQWLKPRARLINPG